MQQIEDDKKTLSPEQEVLVAAIDGVPYSYPDQEIIYEMGPDPTDPSSFQALFGIGPGCSTPNGDAVPSVRLRAFAESFKTSEDDVNLFSVCRADYSDPMAAIADAIADQIRPSCMRECVADGDPIAEGLQPECTLLQSYDDAGVPVEDPIPACEPGDVVPAGADVCYTALTDQQGNTATVDDDMSSQCIDEGWNLEFRLVRRVGVPAPPGVAVTADCSLSQNTPIDCPSLPG